MPIDETARRHEGGAAVHGDIESFVSPIDQTVISDRKQLREHNKRNNVVSADEFSPEFYAGKAKEREQFYNREDKVETRKRKMELNEKIERAFRQ